MAFVMVLLAVLLVAGISIAIAVAGTAFLGALSRLEHRRALVPVRVRDRQRRPPRP